MLQRLYAWVMGFAGHRRALPVLALVSFAESSFFPVPPDVMLLPMALAKPRRAWFFALVCTIASVAGGIAGYAIGALLYDGAGQAIIEFYGLVEKFAELREYYNAFGVWIVFAAGFTPIPYKVFTIASGVAGLDLVTFVVASALSRGARFFLEAALLYYFGEPIRAFIERRLPLLAGLFVALLFGGFLILRYVF